MPAKVTFKGNIPISKIAVSPKLAAQLEPLADGVLDVARMDPNEYYVSTLRKVRHISKGKRGRVSWRVGAAPIIGRNVEAIRGTMARALSRLGF